MKTEDIKKIAVMGAGDMGHGIAEVALLAGYKVAMRDIEQRFIDRGLSRIKDSLDKLVEKQKVAEENKKAMLLPSLLRTLILLLRPFPRLWTLRNRFSRHWMPPLRNMPYWPPIPPL
jgi:hypothetical protein